MANVNTPFGLRPVGTMGSNTYNGKIEKFYVPATDGTAIGIGDPVALAGGVIADGTRIATRGTPSSVICGVMVGVQPLYGGDLTVTWRKASTAMYILVEVDPNTIFEIQEDSVAGAIAIADGTKNGTIILGTVDTTTGNSKTMLDSSTVTASATLDLLLLHPVQSSDNTAAAAYCKWLVKLNLHQYAAGVVRVGV